MTIDIIAGTRPNFVKIAAIIEACKTIESLNIRFIHTGQHYDEAMSGSLLRDMQLPAPDINLNAGSGTQSQQTAAIMIAYEKVLCSGKPDICLVVGDVTSSMACAVTAKKLGIKIAHVEAGIRSNDWSMPEEVNRVIIDSITNYFFTTTPEATLHLIKIGAPKENVYFVGNTMIDTLLRFQNDFRKPVIWDQLELQPQSYLVLTLHRPNNVDSEVQLKETITEILRISNDIPVIFPAHPRTLKTLDLIDVNIKNFHLISPLGYLEFNFLVKNATAVITDSGGITEEATVLGVPCLTLRDNTERPETVELGTNELIGTNPKNISPALRRLFSGKWKSGTIPEKWDGKSAERIAYVLSTL